jgi:hypothetical protein
VCRFRVAAGKAKHWTRHPINCLELSQASKHHLQSFGFFPFGSINLGFLLRENLAVVLIIPSSWGSQLDGALHHQHRAASISKKTEAFAGGRRGDCGGGARVNCTPRCSRLGRAHTWFRQESYLPPSIPSTARPPGDRSRVFRYHQAARTEVSKSIFQFYAISNLTCSDL